MAHYRDLEEYTDTELREEMTRRYKCHVNEECDYCRRPWGTKPACKFPKRHIGEEE